MPDRDIQLKKRALVSILCLAFVLLSSLYGEADPSLLWRREFDARIIKTSLPCDFMPSKTKDQPFPIRAIMTKNSVYSVDSNGKAEKKMSLEDYDKTVMADNGFIITTMKDRKIHIFTLDKKEIVSINIPDPQPAVLPHHIDLVLSPNGESLVIISNFTHTIYFYNQEGKLLSKHILQDVRGAEVRFSKDSKYAAIHVPNWGTGRSRGFLLFFDQKGRQIWRFDHKGCQAKFDISEDGRAIVLTAEGMLYSLDHKGTVRYEKNIEPGQIDIALSDDGQYVAMFTQETMGLSFLDHKDGHVIWEKNIKGLDSRTTLFFTLDLTETGNSVAITLCKDFLRQNSESIIYLFDKAGNMSWTHGFTMKQTDAVIASSGRSILIRGDNEVFLYGL